MKKIIRTAVLIFALTVLCFSLSACHALDETKKVQAFKNDDGTVLYDGKIYKALPDSPELSALSYALASDRGNMVFLTDRDVPVLLSAFIGEAAFTDKDKKIIFADYLTDGSSNSLTFCREDLYDTLLEEIKNPVYTKYVMKLDTSWLGYLYGETDIPDSIPLTDAEVAAIEEVIALNDTVQVSSDRYSYLGAEIHRYTEDELFSEAYCTLIKSNDSLLIVPASETVTEGDEDYGVATAYKVPTSGEAAAKIKNLFEKKEQIAEKIAELIGDSDILDDPYDPYSW